MPVSIWLGLEDCLQAITECWPCSVLEAGIGFGLFGHLLRQYLDVWEGRIQRGEWRIRIDGIEIDARRIQPHAHWLYGDVLEHLPKDDAVWLLRKSIALAMKRVIVRIPLGDGWRKQGREEPDHHRSTWSLEDFAGPTATIRQYHYIGNPYALVAIDAPANRGLMLEKTDRGLLQIEERVRRLVGQRGDA